jgi:hypothetical protein
VDIVKRFNPQLLLHVAERLGNAHGLAALDRLGGKPQALADSSRATWRTLLTDTLVDCAAIGLVVTAQACRRALIRLDSPDVTWEEMGEAGRIITDRLVDEADLGLFLVLDRHEAGLYEHYGRGWEPVVARFPSTATDIEEASKCFALGRYAAAVFHSIQVAEAVLVELGKFIGVNDPTPTWASVSNRLNAIAATKYPQRSRFEQRNGQWLEQLRGTVEALKNAWRNKISHSEGRLALLDPHFSAESAEEILTATRAFTRRVGEGLPPPKQPARRRTPG